MCVVDLSGVILRKIGIVFIIVITLVKDRDTLENVRIVLEEFVSCISGHYSHDKAKDDHCESEHQTAADDPRLQRYLGNESTHDYDHSDDDEA